MSGSSVITPTGDRPEAFKLCRKWLHQQTIKPEQWIIVDDGVVPLDLGALYPNEIYVRREPKPNDPKHTLVINIDEGLKHITGDKIFFWEDDEYYAPTYLEAMLSKLNDYDVVGIGCAKYYHLVTGGYVELGNMEHASLAQTAFNFHVLPLIKKCVLMGMERDWLDCNIWKQIKKSKKTDSPVTSLIFKDDKNELFVGMKGLPGRLGIGIGHKIASYKKQDDENRSILKAWNPNDYQTYLDLLVGVV